MRPREVLRHAPIAVDQGISSASNFLLAILVAHSVTATGYGHFALATSVYWLVLGGLRALVAEPMLILQGREGGSPQELAAAAGLAVSITLVPLAVGLGLLAVQGQGPVNLLLVCLPVLIWQDQMRYCAFCLDRSGEALLSDGIWLILLIGAGVLILVRGGGMSPGGWILIWAGCCAVAAVVTSIRLRLRPSRALQGAWWSRSRGQGVPMLGDFMIYTASQQIFVFLLPVVTSFAVLGQLKAAEVATGPLSVLVTAVSISALPLLARRSAGGRVPLRAGFLVGMGLAAVAGAYGLVLLFIPTSWGSLLFGATWAGVGIYPALLAFQSAVMAISQGATMVLRAVGRAGRLLAMRVAMVPLNLAVPLVTVRLYGLTAMGIAILVLALFYVAAWWALAIRVARQATPVPAARAEPVAG